MHAGSVVDREALTVAMALAPGVYARNRMFSLFKHPEVKRAKARAAMIRGVVRHLAGAHGDVQDVAVVRHGDGRVLRYRVERMKLDRRVELDEVEVACLLFLAERAGVRGLHPSSEERVRLDGALRRLAGDLRVGTVESLLSREGSTP